MPFPRQELASGGEGLDRVPGRRQQSRQALPHGAVIVHDEDLRRDRNHGGSSVWPLAKAGVVVPYVADAAAAYPAALRHPGGLWTADVLFWWLRPARYATRSPWVDWTVHGFMAFIVFNATVVFGSGWVRWSCAIASAGLGLLWWRRRFTCALPGASEAIPRDAARGLR